MYCYPRLPCIVNTGYHVLLPQVTMYCYPRLPCTVTTCHIMPSSVSTQLPASPCEQHVIVEIKN